MPSSLQTTRPSALQGFSHSSYTLVRPLFSWRRIYRVFAPDGSLSAFVEQPWFRLRTELTIYADEEMSQPILLIKNRRFAAVNMEHDLFDAVTGQRLGVVRTRGLRSLFRDTWDILDADERPAGMMVEDGQYWLRRVFRFIPGRHRIELGGREVALIEQQFHFFRRVFDLTLLPVEDPIEPRFAIACALIALMAPCGERRANEPGGVVRGPGRPARRRGRLLAHPPSAAGARRRIALCSNFSSSSWWRESSRRRARCARGEIQNLKTEVALRRLREKYLDRGAVIGTENGEA